MNKTKKISFRTGIFITLYIFSCSFDEHKFELVKSVKIQEDSIVIHNPPIMLNIINDSLVGMGMTALNYCIYNYKSGKIVKKITIDNSVISKSINIARIVDNKNYQEINSSFSHQIGITPYETRYLYTNKSNDTAYLFFYSSAALGGYETTNGKTDSSIHIKKLGCIGLCSLKDYKIYKVYYIPRSDSTINPDAITGTIKKNDLFYMRNGGSYNLVSIVKKNNDSIFSAYSSMLNQDSMSRAVYLDKKMQRVNFYDDGSDFTICDGFKFTDSHGNILYKYNTTNPNEQIVSFKKEGSKLLFCSRAINNDKTTNSIYVYNLTSGMLALLYRYDGISIGNFNDRNEFISMIKDTNDYYFKIYNVQ